MEAFLSRIGEIFGTLFGSFARSLERMITNLFGSSNDRYLRRLAPTVSAICDIEPKYKAMSDDELREQTTIFRKRFRAGETLDDLLIEVFAVCREAGRRYLDMRHYDVQLMGGMVLHSSSIAEMITGEGKTLVATLTAYLNALAGSVHVITVNDYLARRDMEWMGSLYLNLGLTVGVIQSNMPAPERQRAYQCDITYGTNNEFGFDYLRDNMRIAARDDDRFPREGQQVQSRLQFAIIDEVDNILIDEARTPLIISGPAMDDVSKYRRADAIARKLTRGDHFEVNEKDHSAHMTDEGVRVAEHEAGVESFYTAGNMEWPHLIDNSLKAHYLYKLDVNYVIQNGEIVIVDEFTGRLMPGRNWSDGLHQAIEAKEGVTVKRENQTLATITLQNFFKLYARICGMTGTAMTEASEFNKIYGLDVIAIPPNRKLHRTSHPDVIYMSEDEKYEAVADEIERINKWDVILLDDGTELTGEIVREDDDEIHIKRMGVKKQDIIPTERVKDIERRGRPILVGTVSIERSELIGRMLERRGIPHQVLNAKHHQREAEIVAQAGRKGAVTIATNMAGRGTDIILGGNPEAMAWAALQDTYPTRLEVPHDEWIKLVAEIKQREGMEVENQEVLARGGLHIIGTERHESRRIDLQLRGRCGRQGDPGSSRFYLSLEDDLMRIFAGEWVRSILQRLGMKQGEAIESRMVSRRIEGAQKKVEEKNFEIRKSLLEYDEVMDEQRKRVYGYRQRILDGTNCKRLIFDMIDEQIANQLDVCLDRDYGPEVFARFAGRELVIEFESRDFRGMTFEEAQQYAIDSAHETVTDRVEEIVEENISEDMEESDWNWGALVKAVNSRWQLSLRERELKRLTREELIERLILHAQESVRSIDLSVARDYLSSDFGMLSALGWLKQKFDLEMSPDDFDEMEPERMHELIMDHVSRIYAEKEIEYPVLAGLYHFTIRDAVGNRRYDREGLVGWTRERFSVELDLEDLKRKQRHEIRELLIEHSRHYVGEAEKAADEMRDRTDELFEGQPPSERVLRDAHDSGRMETFIRWLADNYQYDISVDDLLLANPDIIEDRLLGIVEGRYRSEMQNLERRLVLEVVDHAWKDHLLTMDHLRSSVGLRGWAQVDPKVEYKREGMRTFERMWQSIGDQVTDLVFRIEQLDEQFVSSTWSGATARHEEARSAIEDIAQQQQDAVDGTEQGGKAKPIRNRGERIGRNSPCPCGSGKKYKNCCRRKHASG